jgi:ureidoglycolate lyase
MAMPQSLPIQPLTKSAFAPFGDLIEADPATMRLINGGTTERFHALGHAQVLGEGADVIISLFRGQPRKLPYTVGMMERHPFGSQSFHPLQDRPWLVVVAEDEGGKPGIPQVFLASGTQGINYRANTWHHPLMALEEIGDFLVVDRSGPGNNLEEYFYSIPYIIKEISR